MATPNYGYEKRQKELAKKKKKEEKLKSKAQRKTGEGKAGRMMKVNLPVRRFQVRRHRPDLLNVSFFQRVHWNVVA